MSVWFMCHISYKSYIIKTYFYGKKPKTEFFLFLFFSFFFSFSFFHVLNYNA